jgi:hypothetical protein
MTKIVAALVAAMCLVAAPATQAKGLTVAQPKAVIGNSVVTFAHVGEVVFIVQAQPCESACTITWTMDGRRVATGRLFFRVFTRPGIHVFGEDIATEHKGIIFHSRATLTLRVIAAG